MFKLVEPFIFEDDILNRPLLGPAMLIAACQEKGIKTTLIQGKTRYIRNMFIDYSEELWNLIQDLKEDALGAINTPALIKRYKQSGLKQFQDELKFLYQYLIIDKDPRHYFDASKVMQFINACRSFANVYLYYLDQLHYTKLKIIDHYVCEILKGRPGSVGFSIQAEAGNSPRICRFDSFSRIIRKRIKESSDIPIIVGGPSSPYLDFQKIDKIFKDEYLDYLIVGPGEYALPSLIEALKDNKEPRGVSNVFYKKRTRVIGNNIEVIKDLDNLPYPDFSQSNLNLYLSPKKVLPLETSRGCSWKKCAFCARPEGALANYNTFTIERIIEIIRYLSRTYSCQHFAFHDDELPPNRARRISQALLDNKVKGLSFTTRARFDKGYNNRELLGLMHRAGFRSFIWGLESGSQRVLDSMNKGTQVSTITQILKKSSKQGIANICYIFFGFPGETRQEANQTVKFINKYAQYIDALQYTYFRFNVFSLISKKPERWGVRLNQDGSFSTRTGMTPRDAKVFHDRFHKKFIDETIKGKGSNLNYLPYGRNRTFLISFCSSYKILSDAAVYQYLKKKKFNDIFPLMVADSEDKSERIILHVKNFRNSIFFNEVFLEKQVILEDFQKKIFVFSDGKLSLERIIKDIYERDKNLHSKDQIYKRAIACFRDMFSRGWILVFERPWG